MKVTVTGLDSDGDPQEYGFIVVTKKGILASPPNEHHLLGIIEGKLPGFDQARDPYTWLKNLCRFYTGPVVVCSRARK